MFQTDDDGCIDAKELERIFMMTSAGCALDQEEFDELLQVNCMR